MNLRIKILISLIFLNSLAFSEEIKVNYISTCKHLTDSSDYIDKYINGKIMTNKEGRGFDGNLNHTKIDYTIKWNSEWFNILGQDNNGNDKKIVTSSEYDFLSCIYPLFRKKYKQTRQHGAVDLDAEVDDNVFSIADGKVIGVYPRKTTKTPSGQLINTSSILIEYHTKNNIKFIALYGHVRPKENSQGFLIKEGDKVKRGEMIGKVKPYGKPPHIHLTISKKYNKFPKFIQQEWTKRGTYFGSAHEGMVDPVSFLSDNDPLPNFSNKNFCTKYNQNIRNNAIPHEWGNTGIFLQDCENDKTPKESAVFYNNDNYFLVEQGFWEKYSSHNFGINFLGRPTSNPLSEEDKKASGGEDCQSFVKGVLLWNKIDGVRALLNKSVNCSNYINYTDNHCFNDVYKTIPYSENICKTKGNKIIDGYDDGNYKPNQLINRAEFTKMIVKSIDNYTNYSIENRNENLFDDVPIDVWFAEFIYYAKDNSIVKGKKDGKFYPADNINYAEASKIIVIALIDDTIKEKTGNDWYQPFIEKLEEKGISFSPSHKLTRAEMAYIVSKL